MVVQQPSDPVDQSTMLRLLRNRLDLGIAREMIKRENEKIAKYENELHLMGDPEKYPTTVGWRLRSVADSLRDANWKLQEYESEKKRLVKFLKTAE